MLFYFNVLSTDFLFLGPIIAIFGYFIIFILIIMNKPHIAFVVMIVFLTTTIEMQQFVLGNTFEENTLVNFLYFPYLGVYPLFFTNLIFFTIFWVFDRNNLTNIFKRFKIIKKLSMWLWILSFTAILSTLITILLNDNNINNLSWYYSKLYTEIFKYFMIFFIVQNTIAVLLKYNFSDQLTRIFFSIFVSSILGSFLSVLSGYHGYYSYLDNVLLLSLFSFFSVLIILFANHVKSKIDRVISFFLGVSMFVLMLFYSSPLGGKWFFVLLLLLIVFILKFISKLSYSKILFGVFFLITSFLVFVFLNEFRLNNDFFTLKFDQFIETISIFRPNWFQELSDSPKFRIDEFINITIEYINKPIYVIFGKGLSGSINYHTGILNWSARGSFPLNQSQSNTFIDMHESLNILYLKNGLLGIIFFLHISYISVRNIKKNPFVAIGFVWFVFFFGVYNSLLIGCAILVHGYYLVDLRNSIQATGESEVYET